MNQQESDQIWQHLQAHIENYFSPTLPKDVQRLEYKPIFVALLEMPSEHHPNNQLETSRGRNTSKIKI